MNSLTGSPRDRLKRIRERLGAVPATIIILVLIGPVWIGYNGLELVIAPLVMIAIQALGLHSLLRGYEHRMLASLLATILTFPLALLAFSLLTVAVGAESLGSVFEIADPWTVGSVVLAMTLLGGFILIGFPLGFGVALGRIRTSTRRLLVAISAFVVAAIFILVSYDVQKDPIEVESGAEAVLLWGIVVLLTVPLTGLTFLGSLVGYHVGWLVADRVRPGFEALLNAARYLQPLLWPSVGFFIGYLAFAVIFAGYYATLGLLDEQAYQIEPEGVAATMGDYLYFSLMTMLAMDNGMIQPSSPEAKLIIAIHAMLTTGWNLAFFAAVTAYVQRFWSRIDYEEHEDTTSSAGEVEERLVNLEAQLAGDQERASARHLELLAELREIEARRASQNGGP